MIVIESTHPAIQQNAILKIILVHACKSQIKTITQQHDK